MKEGETVEVASLRVTMTGADSSVGDWKPGAERPSTWLGPWVRRGVPCGYHV
jgi:hypothetical protein